MNVLKVSAGKMPERIEVENTLEELQKQVGGYIQAIYPFDNNVGIICNEEGKIMGLEPNRALIIDGHIVDILVGDILIVGLTEDDFRSLTVDEFVIYEKLFKNNVISVRFTAENN